MKHTDFVWVLIAINLICVVTNFICLYYNFRNLRKTKAILETFDFREQQDGEIITSSGPKRL